MSVVDTLTFLQTPPIRPGLADIVDGTKTNSTPTVPPHLPNAAEFNQMAAQIAALSGMIPVAGFSVSFSAGTPGIIAFKTIRGDMVIGDFTVVDNGQGDTTIKWTAGKFPAAALLPTVSFNLDSTPGTWSITAASFSGGGFEGVRVRCQSDTGTMGDLPFTVLVY